MIQKSNNIQEYYKKLEELNVQQQVQIQHLHDLTENWAVIVAALSILFSILLVVGLIDQFRLRNENHTGLKVLEEKTKIVTEETEILKEEVNRSVQISDGILTLLSTHQIILIAQSLLDNQLMTDKNYKRILHANDVLKLYHSSETEKQSGIINLRNAGKKDALNHLQKLSENKNVSANIREQAKNAYYNIIRGLKDPT